MKRAGETVLEAARREATDTVQDATAAGLAMRAVGAAAADAAIRVLTHDLRAMLNPELYPGYDPQHIYWDGVDPPPEAGATYAMDDHDRDDLPWPLLADAWFWHPSGNRWIAVLASWHEDWWSWASRADLATRPPRWRTQIDEIPKTGTLHYRDADGQDHKWDNHREPFQWSAATIEWVSEWCERLSQEVELASGDE